MKRQWLAATALLVALQTGAGIWTGAHADAAQAAKMTQYRVYQNDKALKEFAVYTDAVKYAQSFAYSHVEKIASHTWMWDNFPRYAVYQNGETNAARQFRTYEEALKLAKTLTNAHIRDLEQPGWLYSRYAAYQLYQGDKTKPAWSFMTLDEAKKEAKNWSNAHIVDIASHKWVWNNITAAQLTQQRAGSAVYQIIVDGMPTDDNMYAALTDAVHYAASITNSEVLNTATGIIAHSNAAQYQVFQNGRAIGNPLLDLQGAIKYAKRFANTQVIADGKEWWTNTPFLTVYQNDRKLTSFHTRAAAVTYAATYADASVRTADGHTIWSNEQKLLYLGWNGTSDANSVLGQLAGTQGLDIDSPTWFELSDSSGNMTDRSTNELAASIRSQGITLWPLVHNNFDAKLTTAFLANPNARQTFIKKLVGRAYEIGAEGINFDFEGLAASDRAAFTSFVKQLTDAAHASKLKVSIDLIRGDVAWNDKTAYDFAAIGEIVDTVVMMAYDQHWKGSDTPGSVAELGWVEQGVQQYLNYGIPRSKVMLGIPFYVREWKLDSQGNIVKDANGAYVSRAIFMNQLSKVIADKQAVGTYDPVSGQTKYKYTEGGFTYVFWAESSASVLQRVDIADKYDLAGVAFWRLGYEDSSLWTSLLQKK
ncbi:glycoside hydrolase [Paenibacillus sp. PR3]|uniref:Glycoside hydrolase n=1 Tax=Paenibacillus terricola TaxID=2763503 RepID=A0ABR8MSD8_9BACL|nr:glycosyl hydrolase family 18 protein [Paenibacillus terricola]MBD3918893.1 glycoside hydrolase [Paenibacillus terricola]